MYLINDKGHNDLECLETVNKYGRQSACPADLIKSVKNVCDYA